ncbi:MAG: KEOPS complex subunit Pcc1 [Nitrososphaerota archaeon]|nr:KEOPS complex subunit Pcc1 [Candidatus Bathyarchaeota archaeon]MDW8048818.1 KEOPS complex subunit Pcc1 [Nitrososphaerota archaeon]
MTKKAEALIQIYFPSKEDAIVAEKSLRPEERSLPSERSKVQIRRRGRKVTLYFESKDVPALRASINSFLCWMYLLRNLQNFIYLGIENDECDKAEK